MSSTLPSSYPHHVYVFLKLRKPMVLLIGNKFPIFGFVRLFQEIDGNTFPFLQTYPLVFSLVALPGDCLHLWRPSQRRKGPSVCPPDTEFYAKSFVSMFCMRSSEAQRFFTLLWQNCIFPESESTQEQVCDILGSHKSFFRSIRFYEVLLVCLTNKIRTRNESSKKYFFLRLPGKIL